MKGKLGLLLMAAAIMGNGYAENSNPARPEDIDTTPKHPVIPKGCKKYFFRENFGVLEVIAMSEKSALKKYNKWCAAHKSNEKNKEPNAAD